jgi:hypothetical protein
MPESKISFTHFINLIGLQYFSFNRAALVGTSETLTKLTVDAIEDVSGARASALNRRIAAKRVIMILIFNEGPQTRSRVRFLEPCALLKSAC